MKVLLSWIREFVDVADSADEIGRRLSLRGLALEGLEPHGDDAVLDFEVTANRPDCLSMIGIAREVAATYGVPLRVQSPAPPGPGGVTVPVTIDEPDLCGRYVAAVAEVAVGPSPDWMQARLSACGVRPISNIVDITNYVLLECGHPMHAFDLDKLAGPAIRVRRARPGEQLKTLDGKMRALAAETLVIADAERAQAIGGVMGGAESEVTSATRRIVFESAWFQPASVHATSKRLGLRTEASVRFERGADRTAPDRAMARACALLADIGAGRPTGQFTDVAPRPYAPGAVKLERHRLGGLLGMEVPDATVVRILRSLGFDPSEREGGWLVAVPAWRVDIHRPVDLVEEVGRHYGFEHLPSTFPGVQQAPGPSDPRLGRDQRVRGALLGMGFSEAITFAFVEDGAAAPFASGRAPLALANPLSEKFAVMRPSLLCGLVDSVSHNRRHQRRDVRLFEIGTRFSSAGESRGAAVAWTGLATADHWGGDRRDVDFFDIKGVVEQLSTLSALIVRFEPAELPYLVPGQAATISVEGTAIGVCGRLAAALADARGLPAGDAVFVAEVDLDLMTALGPGTTHRATPLPRYPSVVRDVSVLIDERLSAETVRGTIRASAPATLIDVREFDRYQGRGVPDGRVSLSLRLTFQALDRTLTDQDVQEAMQRIVAALVGSLGATQR